MEFVWHQVRVGRRTRHPALAAPACGHVRMWRPAPRTGSTARLGSTCQGLPVDPSSWI